MRFFSLTLLLVLSACAGKYLGPPDEDYTLEIKQNLKNGAIPPEEKGSEGIVRDYYTAKYFEKSSPQKSCELYLRITNKEIYPKIFALRDLAIIRQMGVCKMNQDEAKNFWKKNNFEQMPSWVQEEYFRAAQGLADQIGDKEWYAEWTFKLAKFEKVQADKEKYIQLSMNIAQSLKLDEKFNEYQNELIKIAPRFENFKQIADIDMLYKVAYDYEKARKFKEARTVYEKIIQNDKNEIRMRLKSLQRIIFCYKKDRDNDSYILARKRFVHFFDDLVKKFPEENKYKKYRIHAALRYARAKWSKIGREESKPFIQNLLIRLEKEDIKSRGFLAQAHWLLGNMATEEKKPEEALIHFQEGLKHCQKDRTLCHNLTWAVAWAKYNQNKFDEAENAMNSFLQKVNNRNDHQRFVFWLAKSLKNQNKIDESTKLFEELINLDPYSFYGMISLKELGDKIPEIDTSDKVEPLDILEFNWSFALGEFNLSQKILDSNSRKLKSNEERERMIPLYVKINSYQSALGEYQKLPEKYRKENFGRNALYIFPFAYENEIRKYSTKFNIPYGLMASIIRQESSFNQYARSPADAFGPMQLIPEAAKLMAKKYKLPFGEARDLFDPEVNIALGAALLRDLMNENNSRLIPVVASYNAGSIPVKRWEIERQNGSCLVKQCGMEEFYEDALKFIESIPYEETKKYVKLVFRNMVTYLVLEKKDDIDLPIQYFYSM